ncbi:MAG: hypothetical protein ACSHX9_13635 [Luteolibacter sp.]
MEPVVIVTGLVVFVIAIRLVAGSFGAERVEKYSSESSCKTRTEGV